MSTEGLCTKYLLVLSSLCVTRKWFKDKGDPPQRKEHIHRTKFIQPRK